VKKKKKFDIPLMHNEEMGACSFSTSLACLKAVICKSVFEVRFLVGSNGMIVILAGNAAACWSACAGERSSRIRSVMPRARDTTLLIEFISTALSLLVYAFFCCCC
jgi:hypothetical protein